MNSVPDWFKSSYKAETFTGNLQFLEMTKNKSEREFHYEFYLF